MKKIPIILPNSSLFYPFWGHQSLDLYFFVGRFGKPQEDLHEIQQINRKHALFCGNRNGNSVDKTETCVREGKSAEAHGVVDGAVKRSRDACDLADEWAQNRDEVVSALKKRSSHKRRAEH